MALGSYPVVGLKDARAAVLAARKQLAAGQNPNTEKKRAVAAAALSACDTFKLVADELIAKGRREGRAEITSTKTEWLLVKFGPAFNTRPVSEIAPFEILEVLRGVERAGHILARTVCRCRCRPKAKRTICGATAILEGNNHDRKHPSGTR